jgi:hypothetical protein
MAVIQVLARDTSELVDRLGLSLERVRSVDEQVARLALKEEGADLERGAERQRLGR